MDHIINKVKESSLITIDIKDFYQDGERKKLEFSDLLDNDVLIEKKFRKSLLKFDWSKFQKSFVYVSIEKDLIIPSWAYLLLSYYLSKNCKDFVIGSLKNLEEKLYNQKISDMELDLYKNKKIIIKGCSEIPFYECIYSELTRRLSKVVYSLMYGEPCSRVPIFRNKKQ